MRSNLKPLPSVEILREHFQYDPKTGNIIRLKKTRSDQELGKPVGYVSARGYRYLKFKGRGMLFHRVAWKLMTGEDPTQEIDHINKDRLDNRWSNLRAVTPTQNLANRPLKGQYLPGVKRRGTKFQAQINKEGLRLHLGTFETEAEAHAAYVAEHVSTHGEFSAYARTS